MKIEKSFRPTNRIRITSKFSNERENVFRDYSYCHYRQHSARQIAYGMDFSHLVCRLFVCFCVWISLRYLWILFVSFCSFFFSFLLSLIWTLYYITCWSYWHMAKRERTWRKWKQLTKNPSRSWSKWYWTKDKCKSVRIAIFDFWGYETKCGIQSHRIA